MNAKAAVLKDQELTAKRYTEVRAERLMIHQTGAGTKVLPKAEEAPAQTAVNTEDHPVREEDLIPNRQAAAPEVPEAEAADREVPVVQEDQAQVILIQEGDNYEAIDLDNCHIINDCIGFGTVY